jgi:hypothetical protein
LDVHSPEEDDLFLFLTVEDAPPVKPTPASPAAPEIAAQAPAPSPPPTAFSGPPPPTMPEELSAEHDLEQGAVLGRASAPRDEVPPPSMPEEMPRLSELDLTAPPAGAMPEEARGPDEGFVTPPHAVIEPDLAEFMPPVERFFAPLDAPPTMPEGMPSFGTPRVDETPISWASPPPLDENPPVHAPQLLIDALPGPRIIAGNLARAGMLVTIRDARGNSIVTVSGVAKQYGSGGFEAPLTEDGAYHVRFDGTELDVRLENETVFIYHQ